jgi:nucleoid-associated protein YgaU
LKKLPKKVVGRTSIRKSEAKKKNTVSIQDYSPSSYKNLFYGAITVVVIVALLFGFFRIFSQNSRKDIADKGLKVSEEKVINTLDEYKVAAGETLWSISEKVYKDGYKWVEIAKANKLENPDLVEEGTKLVMPKIATESNIKVLAASTENVEKTESDSYIVKEGDNLWNICVKEYGDGYKWSEVAKANNIDNPDLIHPGNTINL